MIEDLDLLSVTKDISNINDFKLESEDLTLYLRLSLKDGSDKKVELYKYPSGYQILLERKIMRKSMYSLIKYLTDYNNKIKRIDKF